MWNVKIWYLFINCTDFKVHFCSKWDWFAVPNCKPERALQTLFSVELTNDSDWRSCELGLAIELGPVMFLLVPTKLKVKAEVRLAIHGVTKVCWRRWRRGVRRRRGVWCRGTFSIVVVIRDHWQRPQVKHSSANTKEWVQILTCIVTLRDFNQFGLGCMNCHGFVNLISIIAVVCKCRLRQLFACSGDSLM